MSDLDSQQAPVYHVPREATVYKTTTGQDDWNDENDGDDTTAVSGPGVHEAVKTCFQQDLSCSCWWSRYNNFIKFMLINWFKPKSTPGAWMHGHLGYSLSEESSSNAWRICHRSSWSMSRQLWHHWQQRVCHRGAWYKIRWIFERLELFFTTVIVRIFIIGAVNVTLSCCVYNDKLFQKDTMIKADAYRCEILVCEEKVGVTKCLQDHFSL